MHDLYIWAAEHPVDLSPLKEAKANLIEFDDTIRPNVADELLLNERVIAIGTRPAWLCDYYLVAEDASIDEWTDALAWALGLSEDRKATSIVDTLTSHFGAGVREVPPEELEARQRLRDYQQNRV